MKGFIEVTESPRVGMAHKHLININHIVRVRGTYIILICGSIYDVDESYEKIKELIEKAHP